MPETKQLLANMTSVQIGVDGDKPIELKPASIATLKTFADKRRAAAFLERYKDRVQTM